LNPGKKKSEIGFVKHPETKNTNKKEGNANKKPCWNIADTKLNKHSNAFII